MQIRPITSLGNNSNLPRSWTMGPRPWPRLKEKNKKDLESLIKFFSNDLIIHLQGYKKEQYERWLSEYTA